MIAPMALANDITVETFHSALDAVRRVLDGADEALLGVAFVQQRGVNLIEPQLAELRDCRLVCTTAFGSTTSTGLQGAQAQGLAVRVLNPRQGTFHPKLYLSRQRDLARCHRLGEPDRWPDLQRRVGGRAQRHRRRTRAAPTVGARRVLVARQHGRRLVADDGPGRARGARRRAAADDARRRRRPADIPTISDGRPNWIEEVTPDGVWVETERSRQLGRPAQLVPAWMIQIAWEYLASHGTLTNRYLLADDGLNVKRSSFVCALLATLPDVTVTSRRPIELRLPG